MGAPTVTVSCAVCGSVTDRRAGATTCSDRCRQRLHRGTYTITIEDRAAILRAEAAVPIPWDRVSPRDT